MSIATTRSGSTQARIALVPVLALGLLGGSAAIAGPAAADYDQKIRGCTVKPVKPSHERGGGVNFKISVQCDDGRKVHVRQKLNEEDPGKDTKFYDKLIKRHVNRSDRFINSRHSVPRYLDQHDGEEVYHEISFAVEDGNGKLSKWSDWKKSPTLHHVNGR
ncbi:hypothetical protein QFZ70_000193 [Arthrobacter sp. V1I9]|jgi:hypothetical protein|uniref:hypothetical protein n=1 Tax=Arthrobacter sp. V1I9 TaxID=3042275 RepID=UPI0027935BC3|nr:hypothetical protein [Arthrobacter sp. V1I9]MDQ0867720.1 hypothetical protein [Arthrobacter sp. V1I9]